MDPRHSPDRDEFIGIWDATSTAFLDLAASLDDQQWSAPTPCPGWTAGDLVAHVIDIEQLLDQAPRPQHEPDWDALPHATGDVGRFTEVGVDARRGHARGDVVDEFRATLAARRSALAALPSDAEVLSPFGRPTTQERLLRMRILDTWVHEQDIRRAIGQPGGMASDGAIVALQVFLDGLPKAWAKHVGAPAGSVAHVVISDVGRGVEAWVLVGEDGQGAMSAPVDDPDVELTLSWDDFLTLAAGRAEPESVRGRVHVGGNAERGARLLASLTMTP
jgi:uncharacterized protein (TIGR03083 family)